jgi:hypothetical protein
MNVIMLYMFLQTFCVAYGPELIDQALPQNLKDALAKSTPHAPGAAGVSKCHPLLLCNYTNEVGPGEYDINHCYTAGSSRQFFGLTGAIAHHGSQMYTQVTVDNIRWYIQRHPKPSVS